MNTTSVRVFKRDRELEPYFIEYVRLALALERCQLEPVNMSQAMQGALVADRYDEAVNNLLERLSKSYGMQDYTEIITEVGSYYLDKYGEKYFAYEIHSF